MNNRRILQVVQQINLALLAIGTARSGCVMQQQEWRPGARSTGDTVALETNAFDNCC